MGQLGGRSLTLVLLSATFRAVWPDHSYRRAVLAGVGDHVGGSAGATRWLAVPHGEQLTGLADQALLASM